MYKIPFPHHRKLLGVYSLLKLFKKNSILLLRIMICTLCEQNTGSYFYFKADAICSKH